jgi:hypothetical protein
MLQGQAAAVEYLPAPKTVEQLLVSCDEGGRP